MNFQEDAQAGGAAPDAGDVGDFASDDEYQDFLEFCEECHFPVPTEVVINPANNESTMRFRHHPVLIACWHLRKPALTTGQPIQIRYSVGVTHHDFSRSRLFPESKSSTEEFRADDQTLAFRRLCRKNPGFILGAAPRRGPLIDGRTVFYQGYEPSHEAMVWLSAFSERFGIHVFVNEECGKADFEGRACGPAFLIHPTVQCLKCKCKGTVFRSRRPGEGVGPETEFISSAENAKIKYSQPVDNKISGGCAGAGTAGNLRLRLRQQPCLECGFDLMSTANVLARRHFLKTQDPGFSDDSKFGPDPTQAILDFERLQQRQEKRNIARKQQFERYVREKTMKLKTQAQDLWRDELKRKILNRDPDGKDKSAQDELDVSETYSGGAGGTAKAGTIIRSPKHRRKHRRLTPAEHDEIDAEIEARVGRMFDSDLYDLRGVPRLVGGDAAASEVDASSGKTFPSNSKGSRASTQEHYAPAKFAPCNYDLQDFLAAGRALDERREGLSLPERQYRADLRLAASEETAKSRRRAQTRKYMSAIGEAGGDLDVRASQSRDEALRELERLAKEEAAQGTPGARPANTTPRAGLTGGAGTTGDLAAWLTTRAYGQEVLDQQEVASHEPVDLSIDALQTDLDFCERRAGELSPKKGQVQQSASGSPQKKKSAVFQASPHSSDPSPDVEEIE